MPSTTIYQRRIAEGHCGMCGRSPRFTTAVCLACICAELDATKRRLSPERQSFLASQRQLKAHAAFLAALADPLPVDFLDYLVAHCGQWHHIARVPWSCPTCATTYFKEAM